MTTPYSEKNPLVLTPDDRLTDEEREELESVVIGAFPDVLGEWMGEDWHLYPGDDTSPEVFATEIAYIKLFNKPGGPTKEELGL